MPTTEPQKTILITGASSGFGKLSTLRLLKTPEFQIIAAMRGGEARLKKVFEREIRENPIFQKALLSGRIQALDLHLDQPASIEAAKRFIETSLNGKLHILINNAGYGQMGPLEGQTEENLRYQMEVNFLGTMLLTKEFLPFLRATKGKLLMLSSIAGHVSLPYFGAYNASKFALEGYTESLYLELKPFGVQVALIEPGAFKTDFGERSLKFGDLVTNEVSPYFHSVNRFKTLVYDKKHVFSGDPNRVAALIEKLCKKRCLALRNFVGFDAHLLYWVKRLVPEWIRLGLLGFFFRKLTHSS